MTGRHTPERAMALQILAHAAETADPDGRATLLRAASTLSGIPVARLDRLWRSAAAWSQVHVYGTPKEHANTLRRVRRGAKGRG